MVIDASLATKWLITEVDSDEAWRFADYFGHDLHAPDLLHFEVMGVLVRLANQRQVAREVAIERLDWWTTAWNEGALQAHRVTQARDAGGAAQPSDQGLRVPGARRPTRVSLGDVRCQVLGSGGRSRAGQVLAELV